MEQSAPEKNQTILLTDVGSLLGSALANALLAKGNIIFGCGKTHPHEEILQNPNFTLVDIDLSQPLPDHLPNFDIVIHLSSEKIESSLHLSTTTRNILSLSVSGKSQVAICLPLTSSADFYTQGKENKKLLKVILTGDIYGPDMPLEGDAKSQGYYSQNNLTTIISQAVLGDKIILAQEGLEIIYPTYVTDACHAILKFLTYADSKNVRFVVSQTPLTALSASYEIQNAASVVLHKELNIFFSGTQTYQAPKTQPIVKVPDPGFSPKTDLASGCRQTFESFSKTNKVKHHKQSTELAKTNANSQPETQTNAEPKPQIITRLGLKKPKLNFKARSAIAICLLVFLLTVGKLSLDIYLGMSNIGNSKSSLMAGDFQKAAKKAQSSKKHFESAGNEFNLLSRPLLYLLPQKVKSANHAFDSAAITSGALENFSEGAKVLSANLSSVVSTDAKNEITSLQEAQANFSKAHFQASYAAELARLAQKGNLYKSKLEKADKDLKQLSQISQMSSELSSIVPELTAAGSQKSYLVLIENNTELRPGGGFIGNFAVINFKNGGLTSVDVDDIYTIDGQLKEKIDPPPQLVQKLGVKQLYLRDSNWTLDFAINAKTARDFYKKETGRDVDGVIAIDLSFMQNLLDKIGSVKLDDYKEEITAANLFEKGEYYAEIGFFPGSTQKKDFFASLTRNLIDKITSSLSAVSSSQQTLSPWLALVDTAKESLVQKHLLLSLDSPAASSFVKSKGWDNPLPPSNYNVADDVKETRDFLALSEANIGANKVNRYLERKIDYSMTIGRDADLFAKLTLTYKNNSPNDSWPAGTYVNYLRVYTPASSGLEDFKIDNTSDLKKVEVTNQANLTVFATTLEIPVKQTKTIIFTYRIPKNIKLETAPAYSIFFQKQPGTEKDELKFTFDLPAYLKIESVNNQKDPSLNQTYEKDTDLQEDRQFTIGVVKK